MNLRLRRTLITGSGSFGVWDSQPFSNVHDYDTWEAELLEDDDLERHITAGHFVPITLYTDGAFEFEVRVGSGAERSSLSAREQAYLKLSSEPYRFCSVGELNISGIEFIEATPREDVGRLQISAGEYTVTVHLIEWEKEPGAKDTQGHPTPDALPDFVVLVNQPEGTGQRYCQETSTFDPSLL